MKKDSKLFQWLGKRPLCSIQRQIKHTVSFLIFHSGLLGNVLTLQARRWYISPWPYLSWKEPLKATTPAFLHMGRQVLESHIRKLNCTVKIAHFLFGTEFMSFSFILKWLLKFLLNYKVEWSQTKSVKKIVFKLGGGGMNWIQSLSYNIEMIVLIYHMIKDCGNNACEVFLSAK